MAASLFLQYLSLPELQQILHFRHLHYNHRYSQLQTSLYTFHTPVAAIVKAGEQPIYDGGDDRHNYSLQS
jgi:hypothetical protein